jgi:hypothetical protein
MPAHWKPSPPVEETLLTLARASKEIREDMVWALLRPDVKHTFKPALRRSDRDLMRLVRVVYALAKCSEQWSAVRDYYLSQIFEDSPKVPTGADARFLQRALKKDSQALGFDTQTLQDDIKAIATVWDKPVDLSRPPKAGRGRTKDEWVQRRAAAVHLLRKCGETPGRALNIVEAAARESGHSVDRESIKRNYTRLKGSIDECLDWWLELMAAYLAATVKTRKHRAACLRALRPKTRP